MTTNNLNLLIFLLLVDLLLSTLSLAQTATDVITEDTMCASNNTSNLSSIYSQCLNDTPDYESCRDPTLCEQSTGNNVGLAFGLTIAAGLATTLGALLPFVPCIKRSNTRYLAVGLALAAGVMLYVSFTEILTKSRDNFCCETQRHYDLAATLCFFGGICLTVLLDVVVWFLQKLDCGCCCSLRRMEVCQCVKRHSPSVRTKSVIKLDASNPVTQVATTGAVLREELPPSCSYSSTPTTVSVQGSTSTTEGVQGTCGDLGVEIDVERNTDNVPSQQECTTPLGEGDSESQVQNPPDVVSTSLSENTNNYTNASINELFSNSSLLRMNAIIPETASLSLAGELSTQTDNKPPVPSSSTSSGIDSLSVTMEDSRGLRRRQSYQEMVDQKHDNCEEGVPLGPEEFKEITQVVGKDVKKLHRMGILTGLAIGIHNFPEGLATFVATLASPSLGIALAIAIALHNIPEGVCVSMPVYYATGSKVKGFLWAFFSGLSEPFGALLGWLVLKDSFGPLVYGISFGLVGGMMVFITLKELLPMAHTFDKTNGVLVSVFLVVGMAVMAASLLLFLY